MTIGSWRHMRAAALTMVLVSGAWSGAALAQNNGGAAASPVSAGPCSAIAPSAPDQKRDASLIVACARKGFDLGPVERYELINNELLKTALIDTEIAGLRRLWLITLDDEGVPFLEDATGLLARQAGV